jgi:hypothetical protein
MVDLYYYCSLRLYSNAMAVLVILLLSVAAELDAESLIR